MSINSANYWPSICLSFFFLQAQAIISERCSALTVQTSAGKQYCHGNCMIMAMHHATRRFPVVWPWHRSIMGLASTTAPLESTNSGPDIAPRWSSVLLGIFSKDPGSCQESSGFFYPCSHHWESVFHMFLHISSTTVPTLWESWLRLMFFMSMATLLTHQIGPLRKLGRCLYRVSKIVIFNFFCQQVQQGLLGFFSFGEGAK